MDDRPLSPSWPAAPRSGTILVQHPAWEAARNAVLDLAAIGPVTVFLTGEPGSGKTWLLRELAACLGDHGFPTMMLLRGDLPIPLSDGAAVLVDEASYMPDETRAELAVQERGVVVLADIAPFESDSTEDGPNPVLIHLRLLTPPELARFTAEWLRQADLPLVVVDPGGLARLVDHSGGAVRVVAQLLTAAAASLRSTGTLALTAGVIDEVVAFRLGASNLDLTPAPLLVVPALSTVTPPPVAAPRKMAVRWALVGTALAAAAIAIVVIPKRLDRARSIEAAVPKLPPIVSAQLAEPMVVAPPAPIVTSNAMPEHGAPIAALPPLQPANIPAAPLAAPTPAFTPTLPKPTLVQTMPPQIVEAPPAASVPVAVAALSQPTVIPVIAAAPFGPARAIEPLPSVAVMPRSTAGLILVAQRGDTLQKLYADIYRNRRAPPFAEILAANPRPFKPGAIVVFPEPIGGWSKAQR